MQDHNNRGDQTHSLAINRFADWHKEEFLATMLPNHGKPRPPLPLEGQQALMHKPQVPKHMLPTTLDWRGSGADSPVKDQASCGSCWVRCALPLVVPNLKAIAACGSFFLPSFCVCETVLIHQSIMSLGVTDLRAATMHPSS